MLPILPELLLVTTAVAVLLLDLFSHQSRHALAPIAAAGIGAAIIAAALTFGSPATLLGGQLIVSDFTQWFKIVLLLGGLFTVLLVWSARRHEQLLPGSELLTVLLLTQVGMLTLISAADLISLTVCLELSTVPIFALVAWKHGSEHGGEAALKYIVSGALASALLLFGLGLLYGLGGSMQLHQLRETLALSPALVFAAALLVAGVGFKMTLVPFHFWAADVYQGAPTAITAYLSVASKTAGLIFLMQVLVVALAGVTIDWSSLIALIAVTSMTLANLVAIVQQDIKRFMAFSSISQAGNILLGFLGPFGDGGAAMLFYALVFVFTNISVFGVVHWQADKTGTQSIIEYNGLSRTAPLMALVMTLGLFSLAGIPPLAGFVGKFFLFSVAAQAGMHWLVAVAALNATVSLYYYLRVVRAMYIEPAHAPDEQSAVPASLQITLLASSAGTILLGLIPHVYESIRTAAAAWAK